MKRLLSLSLLLLSTYAFSQNYSFQPQWKKGEVKEIKTKQVEREYEGDELISDTTTYNEARIEVIDESDEAFTLEVLFENQALQAAIAFYDKLGEELEDYQDLELIFQVNKETAEAELQNWEDAQKFMNNSFEQITAVLEEKVPDMAPYAGMVFMPLKEMFNSKENIEAYMAENIGYLLLPFGKEFQLGETIQTTETGENPFNPSLEMSVITNIILESVDEKNKSCSFKHNIEFDLDEFIEMMKGMMESMSASFGASDSLVEAKSKEMEDFDMDIQNAQMISFDYSSTWVTKVEGTGSFTGVDPRTGVKTVKEILTTIEIK